MNRRSLYLVSALAVCATVPFGSAMAQSQPAQRGWSPSWLFGDEPRPVPPPAVYPQQTAQQQSVQQQALPPVQQQPGQQPIGQPTQQYMPPAQAPAAAAAPSAGQDALRPPGAVGGPGPATAAAPQPGAPQAGAPQPGQPMVTASLPPEDQPELGTPQELPANLKRQLVDYKSKEPAGTIVIDTANTYLYLVLGGGKALRYGIGVGRDGFTWAGAERVSRMKEWPDWHPPAEMIERQPYLPRMMAGGPGNPLGARALYLGNTLYRIHGTNQPSTIGKNVSSGCIRLLNEDIEDLYSRVQVGTRVVVLPGQPQQPEHTAAVAAPAVGNALPPAPQAGPSPTINGLTGQPIPTTR
jgi:lipoprotein-anchoring transpeptidase ErfK/SrfK